jgi:spermidine/putrescine-binding protein
MTVLLKRRALLAGGLGVAGAFVGANSRRTDRLRAGLVRSRLLATPRDPLHVAMLDDHAARIAPLVPEIEAALGRRLAIEALGVERLYANFTIDLLQQTGRYDVVSMNDAWIPYFGRRGYLTAVPAFDQSNVRPTYPAQIQRYARGVDGTELVAYPWTFDFTCFGVNQDLDLRGWDASWSDAFPALKDVPGERWGVALEPTSSAAETYRAILLSFGSDLVALRTHEPMLDGYAALRALETTVRLAKLSGEQAAMGRALDQVPGLALNDQIDVAPVLWASDSRALWELGAWDLELLPAGREGQAQATGTFWMWGVPAGAPSVDKARSFVELMTSAGMQARLWTETGLLPAHRAAINGTWNPGGDVLKALTLRALDRARFRPQLRSFRTLMEIAGRMVTDTITANDGVQQHVEQANEQMHQALVQEGEL